MQNCNPAFVFFLWLSLIFLGNFWSKVKRLIGLKASKSAKTVRLAQTFVSSIYLLSGTRDKVP